jgi:N-acetylglucosamine kinase-like BadF-type ATPase
MRTFVVGVDGGTTKTIALVADEAGHILGRGRQGGSNATGADVSRPMAVVTDTVRDALAQAHLRGDEVALGLFGLAGADWPEDHERRTIVLQQAAIARQVLVKNDAFIGLRAGTHQPFGVVIAAGTGLNAAAIAPDGREWHFGYYADEGGAIKVGQAALRAVLRAEDGRGAPTALTQLVLTRLRYVNPEALLRARVAGEIHDLHLAALCPLVFEAAYSGDEMAAQIVADQGRALAAYAVALIRRFGMERLSFHVVLAGSVFKGGGPYLVEPIHQIIHQTAPCAHVLHAQFEPAIGALLLAYDALHIDLTDAMLHNLRATMPEAAFFSTLAED